jgi:hypothetical protein
MFIFVTVNQNELPSSCKKDKNKEIVYSKGKIRKSQIFNNNIRRQRKKKRKTNEYDFFLKKKE